MVHFLGIVSAFKEIIILKFVCDMVDDIIEKVLQNTSPMALHIILNIRPIQILVKYKVNSYGQPAHVFRPL